MAALFGVKYRVEYERQIKRHGKIVRRHSMTDPSLVEEVAATIALSVAGSAVYDVLKLVLSNVLRQISGSVIREQHDPTTLTHEDVSFLEKLQSDDNLRLFIGHVREYSNGRLGSADKEVELSIEDEEWINIQSTILKHDPSIFVFSSANSRKFHLRKCPTLRSPVTRIRAKAALLQELLPCRRCHPLESKNL